MVRGVPLTPASPEALLLPELGPSMAPEDHYRRLMSALSEAGACEDPQRFYHLGLPSHGMCLPPPQRVPYPQHPPPRPVRKRLCEATVEAVLTR